VKLPPPEQCSTCGRYEPGVFEMFHADRLSNAEREKGPSNQALSTKPTRYSNPGPLHYESPYDAGEILGHQWGEMWPQMGRSQDPMTVRGAGER
jgi:hypothetical protein